MEQASGRKRVMALGFLKKLRRKAQSLPDGLELSASHKVVQTYELLENILYFLDNDSLRQARLVCTFWSTIIYKSDTLLSRTKKLKKLEKVDLVVFGELFVGIRKLIDRWTCNVYFEGYDPTLEDTDRKQLAVDGDRYHVELGGVSCDSRNADAQWLSNSNAYILVYSCTSRRSFDAVRAWQKRLDSDTEPIGQLATNVRDSDKKGDADGHKSVLLGLLTTKSDLTESREVADSKGEQLARELGCPFYVTSAKDNFNCHETLQDLMRSWKKVRINRMIQRQTRWSRTKTSTTPDVNAKERREWWWRSRGGRRRVRSTGEPAASAT